MESEELMADVLSAAALDDPSAADLVAYARDAAALAPELRARIERYLAASSEHRDRFRALAPPDYMLAGSCLCGAIGYAVRGPLPPLGHCHCARCRKAHGAAFATFALIASDALRWTRGEDQLSRYADGSGRTIAFCKRCGTTLTGNAPPGRIALAVATLDVDPIARPVVHAAVAQHAPWHEITDGIKQLPDPFEVPS